MRTIDVLKKAREILSDPARWTKGALARDDRGFEVPYYDTQAVCFCIAGALYRACDELNADVSLVQRAVVILNDALKMSVLEFNDAPYTFHNDVLDVLDVVIEGLS